MLRKPNPRKVATGSLHAKSQRRCQPPLIQNAGNNQLFDPVETYAKDRRPKEYKDLKEWTDPKERNAMGQEPSNRCLDRCCCVKPQLKDFGQLTQSPTRWDDQTKPGSARPYDRTPIANPVLRTGFPKFLTPSQPAPAPTLTGSIPYIRHASPPPAPVPAARNHGTSPIRVPQRKYTTTRYLPPGLPPRHVHLPKLSRPPTPSVRYPRRLDQWRVKTKIPLKEPATPGGTTIDELKKYIATSGTRLPIKIKRPKPVAVGRRKSIEELKQYLVTSGSIEMSRAQNQCPVVCNIPKTPGPPNVTPKTSFEQTDTSNIQFDTPRTSPPVLGDSRENIAEGKEQHMTGVIVDQLQALKKLLCAEVPKVENSSQFTDEGMIPVGVATSENLWQIVESVGDVAQFLDEDTMTDDQNTDAPQKGPPHDLRSVVVSDKPRIKVIAEKFSKYKKNNIELRKIEEKVVCLEYDVFKKDSGSKFPEKPRAKQVLRAYFSFSYGDGKALARDTQFSKLKEQFISESHEDIKKMGGKEIEIIDGHLEENHCYIQDLIKVLDQKMVMETKKNKTALDVLSLYDMAKTQKVIEEEDIHFLNQAQLAEVREMILKTCESNSNAINRRKIQYAYEEEKPTPRDVLNVSKSIINELFRESRKL